MQLETCNYYYVYFTLVSKDNFIRIFQRLDFCVRIRQKNTDPTVCIVCVSLPGEVKRYNNNGDLIRSTSELSYPNINSLPVNPLSLHYEYMSPLSPWQWHIFRTNYFDHQQHLKRNVFLNFIFTKILWYFACLQVMGSGFIK